MITIVRAKESDTPLIADIGRQTFIDAHAASASAEDIEAYVSQKFFPEVVREELQDESSIFHLIFSDGKPAGYSKIIPDCAHPKIESNQVTKLERLYLLKNFYDSKMGLNLLEFNIGLSKQLNQVGMWLIVWIGNERAIRFYQKTGFVNIGTTSFKISENHSNPNYWMHLKY